MKAPRGKESISSPVLSARSEQDEVLISQTNGLYVSLRGSSNGGQLVPRVTMANQGPFAGWIHTSIIYFWFDPDSCHSPRYPLIISIYWASLPFFTTGFMDLIANGKRIVEMEADALYSVSENMGEEFAEAVNALKECTGRVIVTGVGKAGLIGRKISATLASTGIASYWMHAVEARHGDLGRVLPDDVVLAISNSGETEVVQLLEPLKKIDTRIIAITGHDTSTLAQYSDIILSIGHIEEACPLGLAPSCTTTAMLAMGDALALTLFDIRDMTKEDYAFYHPGGELGRQLITVEEAMRIDERNPVAPQDITVREAMNVMSTEGSPGAVSLVDEDGKLAGFFTDGDVRRLIRENGARILEEPVASAMTRDPLTVSTTDLAAEAYQVMRDRRIDNLPVVDREGVPVGIIDVQDWLDVERGVESPVKQ